MASRPPDSESPPPPGDPWRSFGYLVSGVAVYGLIGWGLDQWLGTRFLVAVGIVLGAVLGVYMTWARYRPGEDHSQNKTS